MELQHGWVGTDLGDYRPCDGTYQLYSYDDLPPVDKNLLSGKYQWLDSTPAENPVQIGTGVKLAPVEVHVSFGDDESNDDLMDEWDRRYKKEQAMLAQAPASHPGVLAELVENLAGLGFTLPLAFTDFLGNQELMAAVSTCTGCMWDIPTKPADSPLADGAYLVRFMRDSQDLLFWYLHLDAENSPFVVVSSIDFETAGEIDAEQALQQFWACAPEFEEFIYRFWMENAIWFTANAEEELTAAQLAYARHYEQ
jgi:hypothetical protein